MSNYISQIITAVFLAFAAFLGYQAKALYKKYVNTEIKKAVVKNAVLFVEQTCKDIHGHDKLVEAMKRASAMLAEYGIEISDTELVTMIESAVKEFINSFLKVEEPKPTYGKEEADQE